MDVRPHPHINLATVTYLFEGAIEHRDSLGTRPGDRARRGQSDDRGQRHRPFASARPPTRAPTARSFYGMQTWLALPDGKEEIDPAFEHVAGDALPLVEGDGVSARVLMGTPVGQDRRASPSIARRSTPTSCSTPARACRSTPRPTSARCWWSKARRASTAQPLELFTLYVLAPGRGDDAQARRARPRPCCSAARPSPTKRHVWWNFVSSSRDRISQAKRGLAGARRFPLVPGDEEEFIPIPEVPKTVSYP